MTTATRIPLVILGGADRAPAALPSAGADHHALSGHKGVDLRVGDRPMIVELLARLRVCDLFEPIVVAGPARAYANVVPAGVEIVDTDGSVGHNIRAAIDELSARAGVDRIAFTACDVLPEPDELRGLIADYRAQGPCDAWFPLIRAPQDLARLGAFAWKPKYHLAAATGSGGEPVTVLPSHLVVVDPRALRLGLLYSLFEIAYRTRNRSIASRHRSFVLRLLADLLYHDLRHVLALRLPRVTWSVLANGLNVARGLRHGTMTTTELQRAIGRMVIKARHRARHPERGVRLPILDGLSLAKDVDTVEEARALAGEVGNGARDAALAPPHP